MPTEELMSFMKQLSEEIPNPEILKVPTPYVDIGLFKSKFRTFDKEGNFSAFGKPRQKPHVGVLNKESERKLNKLMHTSWPIKKGKVKGKPIIDFNVLKILYKVWSKKMTVN